MKVFYMNDRAIPVRVSIETLHDGEVLEPRQGKEFEIIVPDDKILYIKCWEHGQTLIGTMTKVEENESK